MKTWTLEAGVVGVTLASTAAVTGHGWRDWLVAGAVLASFCHAQVAERMREADEARQTPAVACRRWTRRYFLVKEALWAVFFVVSGAWPALVGSVLFMLYPVWRAWYRSRWPRDPFAAVERNIAAIRRQLEKRQNLRSET